MSISHLYPSISPSLSLNFARSKTLDPRITFSRTSTATRVNETGLIEAVPADAPRFDHKYENGVVKSLGLLVEEQRVNYFTESIISNWGTPIQGTKTGSAGISPDGTNTATLIEATSDNNQTRIENGGDRVPGQTYTMSCFCKAGTTEYCTFGLYETTTGVAKNFQAIFYLVGDGDVTYEVNNTATITPFPNGWYKCTMTITLSAGASYSGSGWKLGVCDNPTLFYNVGTGDNVYFWGAQLEQGAFPTSYIPTSGSTATRTVDAVSMAGTNFSSWFNQTEGTLFADFMGKTIRSSITFDRYIAIVGNDPNLDEMGFYTQTADGGGVYKKIGGVITNNTVSQIPGFVSGGGGPDFGGKAILAYKSNDASYTINGATPVTDNTVDLPTFVGLRIFGRARYQPEPSGHISQFIYYPKRLPDTQLINLTK